MPAHFDLLALLAAACWGIGSLISVAPSRQVGAFAYSRWRMLIVSGVLWLSAMMFGNGLVITQSQFIAVALSGVIGIVIGDTSYFGAMNRIGPRRTGILFATNAVFSAAFGMLIFSEQLSTQALIGGVLTVSGVMIAIALGRRSNENHHWETDQGSLAAGIGLGLVAALAQSAGALLAKPAMAEGLDPILASAVRVSVAAFAHFVLLWSGVKWVRAKGAFDPKVLVQTALSGTIGMAVGMTLFLLALRHGDVGLVSILSSVTPVLLLPMLWFWMGRVPAPGAWFGAVLTVVGTGLILTR